MGVKYDYNEVYIEVPTSALCASQIGVGGAVIGSAAEFDRIKSQLPGLVTVMDDISEDYYSTVGFFYYKTSGDIRKIDGATHQMTAKITQDKTNNVTKYANLSV